MGLEGAVKLGYKQELAAVEDEVERQALFDKLVAKMYEIGKAEIAGAVTKVPLFSRRTSATGILQSARGFPTKGWHRSGSAAIS